VGLAGSDLIIHCLALAKPSVAIENPRQIPALKYSRRYGPLPPCFSRATIVTHPVDGDRLLLVAGTASIRGEISVHDKDVRSQLQETLTNLRALLVAAGEPAESAKSLAGFSDVRVYYVFPSHLMEIESVVRNAFASTTRIEMVHAQLCRPELLVEIEGIATLSAGSGS
jgi:chorismate lyase/3-hydroxybenzoate synthase